MGKSKVKRFGILTSGGDAPGLNTAIRGVARAAIEEFGMEVVGIQNGYRGLIEGNAKEMHDADFSGILTRGGTILGTSREKPFKNPLPDKNGLLPIDHIKKNYKKWKLDALVVLGGNGTNTTASYLAEEGLNVIGLPKTIDNDLVGTDHTPGFASAAKYIATTVAECIRDCAVYTTKAVTVIEIMGRDAGWLTASSGIAKAFGGECPDLIYLPERAFNKEEFFEDLRAILDKKPNVVVAVSEGIRFADGTYVCEGFGIASTDVFGHKQLSGTGKALEYAIKAELGCKVRSVELNIVQRCAGHIVSKTDIDESVLVGKGAVKAASEGVTRRMMTIERISTKPYSVEISHRDVSEIANKVKHVPSEFINERGNSITCGCAEYLLPLIQGELDVKYENGIPKHIII